MSVSVAAPSVTPTRASLDGVPWVDVAGNLRTALFAGKRLTTMLREIVALRRAPGRLSMAEYFYYRLWDSSLSLDEKRQFVGKDAQGAMHFACNDHDWYGATQDKLLFHLIATAAGLPVPELLAVVHPTRATPGFPAVQSGATLASLLRDHGLYPFFAKPIDGIYSLGAISADHVDALGQVHLDDGSDRPHAAVADEMARHESGMLIQRRLSPDVRLARQSGNRLWSVRLLVLLTKSGPQTVRAVCKIPAPGNIADNFWRPGNMIAAVDVGSGMIVRAVRGTGQEMELDPEHPETGLLVKGSGLPDWGRVLTLAREASALFPGVRTQSWDIALTDGGPVLLEVNWGGDLNLAQLAYGYGVLDGTYAAHLEANGYEERRSRRRLQRLCEGLRRD
jgi:hypothetical protein